MFATAKFRFGPVCENRIGRSQLLQDDCRLTALLMRDRPKEEILARVLPVSPAMFPDASEVWPKIDQSPSRGDREKEGKMKDNKGRFRGGKALNPSSPKE